MADVHTPAQRSYNMSRIRGKDTKPELLVRSYLHRQGYRFRLHKKELPGKPDIVLPKYNTVIFIHGCFWHSHKRCRYFKVPQTRTDWWLQKIGRNQKNDSKNIQELKKADWNVIILWECMLIKQNLDRTLEKLLIDLESY